MFIVEWWTTDGHNKREYKIERLALNFCGYLHLGGIRDIKINGKVYGT